MDRSLPTGVRPARRTPTFTDVTTPAALRHAHTTAVWAELVVTKGVVDFRDENGAGGLAVSARPGEPVTIVPHRPHAVTPSEDAEFHVQFYDPPRITTDGGTADDAP